MIRLKLFKELNLQNLKELNFSLMQHYLAGSKTLSKLHHLIILDANLADLLYSQRREMNDRFAKQKKRTKSYIEDYEHKKQMLPFIKPRYIKEDMFANMDFNGIKLTHRAQSTNKYSENVRYRYQTQGKKQTSPPKQGNEGSELNKIRIKLKDFYKNVRSGQIKIQREMEQEEPVHEQSPNERSIHFSFVKRKAKRNRLQHQKKQEIHPSHHQEPIYHQKYLYTPVLLNRNFAQRIQYLQTDEKSLGKIKRQSIKTVNTPKKQQNIVVVTKKVERKDLKKRFRKIGNAILFIFFLKRYNKKFQSRRKRYLERNSSSIQQTLMELKLYFSQKCLPLYESLCIKYEHLYQILQMTILMKMNPTIYDCSRQ